MDKSLAIAIIEKQLAWLRSQESDEIDAHDLRWPWLFWPSPSVEEQLYEIQQRLAHLAERRPCRCAMSSSEGRHVMQLMTQVGAAELDRGVDYIRRGLDGVRRLAICDPYLLRGRNDMTAEAMISKLGSAIPQSVKRLEIFVKPRQRNSDVAEELNKLCKQRSIHLTCQRTDGFHDRVWVGDDEVAYSVGASFNGLGNKPAFILPLPHDDARAFVEAVRTARERLPKSKSA